MPKQDIKNFTLKELEELFLARGWKKFRARQVFSWLYHKGAGAFSEMTDLAPEMRQDLAEEFSLFSLNIKKRQKSSDGTEKFLFELPDGNCVEGVVIPAEGMVTGCLSTQAGCKFSCRFCASGIMGFKRDLSCAELVEEALLLKKHAPGRKLTHLVFMGTGEPLDNYDNLMKAIRVINAKEGLNIGSRRITVSTSGVVPGIKRLSGEGLQLELAVSLHAASDSLRTQLMPINRKYPLGELIPALKDYSLKTRRQVTFEYALIKGANSDLQNASSLCKILSGFKLSKVNLIPVNPVKELGVEPPGKMEILYFKDYLRKHGVQVTLRKERGRDIDAACGQLRLSDEKK